MTRVLLVGDEESFSDALSYLLRKQGFQVAVCPAGPDALEMFDRDGADLVLLDLMLPGPAGTDVCRSLRQRSNVPVIMLTAKDTEASTPAASWAGGRTGQLPGREAGPAHTVRQSPRSGELGLLRVTVIFTPSGGWNPPRHEVDWYPTASEGL